MTELLDLNDDCLDSVINFCDVETVVSVSKVCKRLNLLVTTNHFPRQTKFKCTIRSNECEEKARDILDCIAKYLVELNICQTSEIFLFYGFLGRSIGDHIRRLTIEAPFISDTSLQAIEPVLRRIEELKLHISSTVPDDDDLMLQSRCPNLRRLHIQWDTSFTQNTGTWTRLEELSLGDNEYIDNDTMVEFMQNNPQLRKLKIGAFNCELQLHDIAMHLTNLEQLVLFQNYSDLSADSILDLQPLTHLKRLILRNVKASDFEGIVNNVTKLNGLIDLQLQAQFDQCTDDEYFEPKHENIVRIALEMPQLQVFGISFSQLKEETIVEFLRFADNLREIHIHDCDFMLTPENIDVIINARNTTTTRNRTKKLVTFVDCIDEGIIETLRKPDISAHLKAIACRSCEIIPVGFFE
ncbi:uncharacterized protein LOC129576118 isoform X1 [Sitodiplosis mosellana]|uniref:uncharacterized protein LOC129576118 isoform X1 n=1 Tax=Sitodiplosis mosellana TaxID=263140 RepID=UPI002444D298|nr:uncharacterized protein LOC129576118 isoform X1 [Sitodiplosis mosellana]